ncbi:SusC/RagA family TonB-linked outer membrane protein [Barnesiella viscericola]|uniref:SusC/RagA family TonB-linked outer membrane protein n=1 Tax=Barnesiella viscericola TaxID=397865 RepID=UPI003B5A51DD
MGRNIFKRALSVLTVFLLGMHLLYAQNITIKGNVSDGKEALMGVTVQVKGTSKATSTDLDGNYTITVSDKNAVLVFSYIGYEKQEVTVGNRTVVNVRMSDNAQLLDEVVVVGYGSVKKSDVTGAIASLRPDERDAATSLSVDNLLQGKVAGLVVGTTSATPGAASSITIRGASSLRGDNQPLYVIDNIPQASTGEFAASAFGDDDYQTAADPLSSLNPSDIESIEILKDASATAIYGSRGANGVILITTKKGKTGKPRVTVNANFTVANATRLYDMLNLSDYADYRNAQSGPDDRQFFKEGNEVRYIFSGGKYDANDPESYRVLQERDWQREIYRTAFSQNYSVSVNGGSDKVRYFVSAAFKNINGIVKQTGLQQGDLRANLSMDLSKRVSVDLSLSGSIKKNDMMSGSNANGGAQGSVSVTAITSQPFEYPADDPSLSGTNGMEKRITVFSWLNDYDDQTNENAFRASMDLKWNIWKGLTYSLRTGGNLRDEYRARWFGTETFRGNNDKGSLGITDLSQYNITVENMLNYHQTFDQLLDLDATAAITYDDYNYLNKRIQGRQFSNMSFGIDGLHMAERISYLEPVQRDYQLLSYLGRVNLSFLEGRYLATASFRADGSSRFAKGHRWAYFPSFSLAWRMEQEDFIKDNVEWLDQLKVRVGYGQTGNSAIDPYSSFYNYSQIIDYANATGDKVLAMAVDKLQNEGLTWETTESWNVGLDFGVFKNRFRGTLDFYNKQTKDLLISRILPPSAGYSTIYYNSGNMRNQGIEFSLDADIIQTKDFTWTFGGNIGKNNAKIMDLGVSRGDFGIYKDILAYEGNSLGNHFGNAHLFWVGHAPGLFFGYETDGIVQESDLPANGGSYNVEHDLSTGGAPQAGDIKIIDQNGDGTINTDDRVIIGDPNPDFTYGFHTSFTWRGISLSAQFNGVYGKDLINTNLRYQAIPNRTGGNLRTEAFQGAWTAENKSNTYPRVNYTLPTPAVLDRYVEDASFLRCTDITLAYTLPKPLMRKIGFNSINVFASVKNAFLITKYSGYDPEVDSFAFDGLRPGVDMSSFPHARSFIFGLNVSF